MERRRLGKTNLQVSILGIGTGGPSRFGQGSGVAESEVRAMVRRGLELGINFFDSSPGYGDSEARLGRALQGVPRADYVLATKVRPTLDGAIVSAEDVRRSVEGSLRALGVRELDVLQLHGVLPAQYDEVMARLWPALGSVRDAGLCRWVGVTESYSDDPAHAMLERALDAPPFDSVMVGYNLLSPTAADRVLPACQAHDVGVIGMVPVRRALGNPERLRQRLADAVERGVIEAGHLPTADPLGWLVDGAVESVPAAAYKFAVAHPAIATVLTGTSRQAHLEENVRAATGAPLPAAHMARLADVFGGVREALAN